MTYVTFSEMNHDSIVNALMDTDIFVTTYGDDSVFLVFMVPYSVFIEVQPDYFHDSTPSIIAYAFRYCKGLTSITIGNGVTSIGEQTFYKCDSLTSVTIQATTPPSLGSSAFSETNNCPIYVPAESVDAYMQATNWSELAGRIQAIPTE